MLLNYCSSLSPKPCGLKIFTGEGLLNDLLSKGETGHKTTKLVKDNQQFVPTKFHENPPISSGEQVETRCIHTSEPLVSTKLKNSTRELASQRENFVGH